MTQGPQGRGHPPGAPYSSEAVGLLSPHVSPDFSSCMNTPEGTDCFRKDPRMPPAAGGAECWVLSRCVGKEIRRPSCPPRLHAQGLGFWEHLKHAEAPPPHCALWFSWSEMGPGHQYF